MEPSSTLGLGGKHPLLRVGLKLSFMIELIVVAGSGWSLVMVLQTWTADVLPIMFWAPHHKIILKLFLIVEIFLQLSLWQWFHIHVWVWKACVTARDLLILWHFFLKGGGGGAALKWSKQYSSIGFYKSTQSACKKGTIPLWFPHNHGSGMRAFDNNWAYSWLWPLHVSWGGVVLFFVCLNNPWPESLCPQCLLFKQKPWLKILICKVGYDHDWLTTNKSSYPYFLVN